MAVKLGISSQGQTQIEGIRKQEAEENKQMGQRKKLVNGQNCMYISITYTFMKYYQSDEMEEDMMGKMCSTQARAHKHTQSSLRFEGLTVKMTKTIKIFISVLEEHAVLTFQVQSYQTTWHHISEDSIYIQKFTQKT